MKFKGQEWKTKQHAARILSLIKFASATKPNKLVFISILL